MMQQVVCDLCGHDGHEVIYDKQTHQYELGSRVIRDKDGNILNGRTVMCNNCGLVYATPRMSDDELNEFYSKRYRHVYKSAPNIEAEHAEHAMEFAKQYVRYWGNLLDVGSSMSKFVEAAQPLCESVTGIEPNVDGATIENYQSDSRYDVIAMLDVLEHVASPTKALQKVRSLLSDYGVVLLAVPDFNSFVKTPSLDAFFSNAHIYHFSADTLRAMCVKAGLIPVVIGARTGVGSDKIYAILEKCPPASRLPKWNVNQTLKTKHLLAQTHTFLSLKGQGFR